MSKLKTPGAKKQASLKHDHRPAKGKNSQKARKTLPKAKTQAERSFRHHVHQVLHTAEGVPDEALALAADSLTVADRPKRIRKPVVVALEVQIDTKKAARKTRTHARATVRKPKA